MNFSAKKLISQSAMQICYLLHHPSKVNKDDIKTDWMMEGEKFQATIFESLGKGYESEMGGCYTTSNGDKIYFSHDIVSTDGEKIIEVKKEGNDFYYFRNSLLQCAIYDVLTRFSSPFVRKSAFCRTSANDVTIRLKKSYNYYLQFGKCRYNVKLTNPYPLLQFIEEKTKACRSYDSAHAFDANWKGREYELLSGCFNYG